jgi:hypothetical protein
MTRGSDLFPSWAQVTDKGNIEVTLGVFRDIYNSTWRYDLPGNR